MPEALNSDLPCVAVAHTNQYVHSIIKLFVWSDDAGVVISHFTFAEASSPLWKTTAEGRTSDARIVTVGAPTFL